MNIYTHYKKLLSAHGPLVIGVLYGIATLVFVTSIPRAMPQSSQWHVSVGHYVFVAEADTSAPGDVTVWHGAALDESSQNTRNKSHETSASASSVSSVSSFASSTSNNQKTNNKQLSESTLKPAANEPVNQSVSSSFSAMSSSAISRDDRLITPVNQQTSTLENQQTDTFPAFDHASQPVAKIPNWGAMRSATEWNRSFKEMTDADFVRVPAYALDVLTVPMETLLHPLSEANIPTITAKLYYSTRYYGAYDADAGEFTGTHAGIDLKLALGTPIGAIGGGRVNAVSQDARLGLHVIIEHHIGNQTFYSIYGHLGNAAVTVGQAIAPGQYLGNIGTTGESTGPHLHLQIDVGQPGEDHVPYQTDNIPSPAEAAMRTVNPMTFIAEHR